MPSSQDLKEAGLKTTLPRLRILAILEEGKLRHFSAEDVYKTLLDAGEEIAFATVYRVLTQFENAGLVIRHNFEGGRSVFELDRGEHHDHMVCMKCNKVTEFYDAQIEDRQKMIAQEYGFDLQDHSLYLYGICQKCK
jgi:Fur family ferric uptake transcriptional regulator